MKLHPTKTLSVILLSMLALRCGTNIESSTSGSLFGPPLNLKALSVNKSIVRLQWSAASGASDSSFAGYLVQFASTSDTLPKNTLTYVADSLNPGEIVFTVYSRKMSGQLSDGAIIRWAPADRFDSAYVISEYKAQNASRAAGLDVGTRTMNPSTLPVNAAAQLTMDVFLFGGSGQIAEPLELRSASLYAANWNPTLFSTVSHSSPSLDYYLSSFSPALSFTENTVPIIDNTIYYARVIGDNQEVNYVRLHVHLRAGTSFPDRAIEVRLSLQRVSGLLFAEAFAAHREHPPCAVMLSLLK